MKSKKIFNKKVFKKGRKALRGNSTYAEVFLWQQVKNKKLAGKKFRRQTSIGPYIVDFYCPEEHLIVELDGEVHYNDEGVIYDKQRTKYLESLGLKVVRFENQDVLRNTDYVLNKIGKVFNSDRGS